LSDQEQDDAALLHRIAVGEQHALDMLYARYRSRLLRYLAARLDGSAEWAEEVLQETFLSVWLSAHGFRAVASPAAWIFAIARHQLLKAYRTHARHPEHHSVHRWPDGDAEEREDAPFAAQTPDECILDRLELLDAFAQLSFKHREILELAFHYGFAANEIAHILEVPVGTVKSRMSYARQALQRALDIARQEEPPHEHS
jgi:RNA polymerase sigma-70 factor (ECF subfamily)